MKKLFTALAVITTIAIFVSCATSRPPETPPTRAENEGGAMSSNEIEEIFVHSDWPNYNSVDELFSRATDVIRAEVLDEGKFETVNTRIPEPNNPLWEPSYELYTVYQVRVIESFLGDFEVGDIVKVGQVGGEMDGVRVISGDKIPFATGDDLVLFLATFDGVSHAELLTPWQSVYRFAPENGGVMSADMRDNDDRVLENVEGNHLTLTVGDLRGRLAIE